MLEQIDFTIAAFRKWWAVEAGVNVGARCLDTTVHGGMRRRRI